MRCPTGPRTCWPEPGGKPAASRSKPAKTITRPIAPPARRSHATRPAATNDHTDPDAQNRVQDVFFALVRDDEHHGDARGQRHERQCDPRTLHRSPPFWDDQKAHSQTAALTSVDEFGPEFPRISRFRSRPASGRAGRPTLGVGRGSPLILAASVDDQRDHRDHRSSGVGAGNGPADHAADLQGDERQVGAIIAAAISPAPRRECPR